MLAHLVVSNQNSKMPSCTMKNLTIALACLFSSLSWPV